MFKCLRGLKIAFLNGAFALHRKSLILSVYFLFQRYWYKKLLKENRKKNH